MDKAKPQEQQTADSGPSFTPGPWEVGYVGSIAKAFGGGILDGNRNQIALVTVLPDGSDETRRANANLIAAAPDLLSAIKEVKFWLNACQLIINDPDARAMVRDLVQQADAAIAKAEGKTNA